MRSMTWPARSSSVRMSARIARISSRSGDGCCRNSSAASALRRIAPSGWLISCASDAASWPIIETRPACAISCRRRCVSCSACLRAVTSREAPRISTGWPAGVELDTALGRDPAGRAIRQRQPVFHLVAAAIRRPRAPSLEPAAGARDRRGARRCRIALEFQALGLARSQTTSRHLSLAQISSRVEVPNPDAEVGGVDGQAHARLALAQPGLAHLQLVDELRRAQHVTAQLVRHHRRPGPGKTG